MANEHLSLFIVANGEATPATPGIESDGRESVLVAAIDAKAALVIAEAYDRGDVEPDNLAWHDGSMISCVSMRDREGNAIAAGTKFIEAEQDWPNATTRYWFLVDGREFCAAESGDDITYLDSEGYPLTGDPDLRIAQRECVITDEIRRAAAGL